jgi:hypothetical protein
MKILANYAFDTQMAVRLPRNMAVTRAYEHALTYPVRHSEIWELSR